MSEENIDDLHNLQDNKDSKILKGSKIRTDWFQVMTAVENFPSVFVSYWNDLERSLLVTTMAGVLTISRTDYFYRQNL